MSHYLIYLIYLFNILTSFILSLLLFFKKRKKRIILFGHKLEGNIFYFLTSCKEFKYEVFYVSFSFAEYKNLKIKYSNILYALNILHVFKIIESTVLITTHGILFHSFFKNLLGMKTFNIGHGVTNVLNKVSPKEPDQLFDSHWLISNFEKTIIENDLGRKISNLEPTGFLRIDNRYFSFLRHALFRIFHKSFIDTLLYNFVSRIVRTINIKFLLIHSISNR